MERTRREMTFEEEAGFYEKEARAEIAKETGNGDCSVVSGILRRGMRVIAKARREIASRAAVQEWIPVTERLPEEPLQTVLVTNGKETCVAVYSVVYDEFGVMCGKGKAFGVTHWMPMPQPPKGE